MTKHFVCCTPYLRIHTSYDCHLWYTGLKLYLQEIISFFQSFYFPGCQGVKKGEKRSKLIKNFVMLDISRAIHHMIVIYVHICNMIVSPSIFSSFFFFLILIFQVVSGVKGQKMTKNDKKFCQSHLIFSGTIYHMIFIYSIPM